MFLMDKVGTMNEDPIFLRFTRTQAKETCLCVSVFQQFVLETPHSQTSLSLVRKYT